MTVDEINDPTTEAPAEEPVVETPPAEAPVEEPAPETPAEEPEAEPEPEAPAEEPAVSASLSLENTPGVWGYVTVRGTARNVKTLPWLVAASNAPAHFAETPFPVTWVEGTFEATIHLPPGDHTITLCDADGTHASATITVV